VCVCVCVCVCICLGEGLTIADEEKPFGFIAAESGARATVVAACTGVEFSMGEGEPLGTGEDAARLLGRGGPPALLGPTSSARTVRANGCVCNGRQHRARRVAQREHASDNMQRC
jgi:hypothetical protein